MQYSRPLESRADLDLWAPTFLAGQFGELVLLGFAGPGASQDNSMVMEQIRAFIPDEDQRTTFFQATFQRAQRIVLERQAAVRAVALELIQEQTLQAAQALDLIRATMRTI